jgi:hypothetical protein
MATYLSFIFKLNLSCRDGKAFSTYEKDVMVNKGITNMLTLPIDKCNECTFCLKMMGPSSHITSAMEGFPTDDVVMRS